MTTVAPSTALKMAKATFLKESRAPNQEQDLVSKLCEVETSNYLSEDYSWVGEAPRMRLLEDELRAEALSDATYSIQNNTYAIGIEVRRRDLRLDRIGGIMQRVRGLVRVARRFPNRLLILAKEAGTTDAGHDGSPIYSATHPNRRQSGVQSNLLSGRGETTANVQADVVDVLEYLATVRAENDEPYNEGLGKVCFTAPWNMRQAFSEALGATIVNNTSNVVFNDVDLEVLYSARLTDPNDWYADHVGGGHRPHIFQQLDPITFETLGEGSDDYVKKEVLTFKVRWDGAMGWGHFANTCKVVNP